MMRVIVAGLVLAAMAACTSPGPGRATQRELDNIANRYAREETRERQDHARQAEPPAVAPPAEGDTCGAGVHAERVGTPVADMEVPAGARVIRPDSIVTQDFRQDRLNIQVDAQGTITGFRCY